MSFATGFFNTATSEIKDKQDYARAHRAKTRDFLMTYGVQAVTGAKSKANDYVNTGMQLEGMGLEKDDINYLVETSGPMALTALYEKVKGYTPEQLTPKVFRKMIKRTKDYSSESTYQDTINKAFGLYKDNVTDDPAENEGIAHWASMLFNPMAADSSETFIDGYTERDIRRIQGTAAPSMTAPLAVDFSSLPKKHSTTAFQNYAVVAKSGMIATAEADLKKMSGAYLDGTLKAADKIRYEALKIAIEDEDYRSILTLAPDTQNDLLRMDKETGSGLSAAGSFFKFEDGMEEFFVNTASARSGDFSFLEGKWNGAKKNYPDIPPLKDLPFFNTVEEGKASGKRYYIAAGAIRLNEAIPPAEINEAPISNLVRPVFETAAGPLDTASVDTNNITDPSTLQSQMLSLDVPDNAGDASNPMLTGWQNLSMGALSDFDDAFKKFRVGSVNKSKSQNNEDYKAYNDDSDILMEVLDSVGEFIEADAGGADEAKLTELADLMNTGLQAAPDRVKVIVNSLIEKLEAGEYSSEPEDNSFLGQVKGGFQDLSNFLGGTMFNTGDSEPSTPEINDPESVRQMGKIPFTNLNATETTDNAIVFNSFDDIKAQLKSGELQQDDVVVYQGAYFKIDQAAAGPIGKVNLIKA